MIDKQHTLYVSITRLILSMEAIDAALSASEIGKT